MVIAPDKPSDIEVVDYENATVYGDFEQEEVLHRGAVRVLQNGWVALSGDDRLLSPGAVYHIDP